MLLTKIRELNEFVHKKPPLGILISYLSNTVSLNGDQAGITHGSLYDGRTIVCEYAFGFSDDQKLVGTTRELFEERPPSLALRNNKIVFGELEILIKDSHFSLEIMIDYPFYAVMPVMLNKFYGFAFKKMDIEDNLLHEYFEAIRSILDIYHTINRGMEGDIGLAELTNRQRQILEMIRGNAKNGEIAETLGYSESLIRQETIVIFRKMGVHGRKDLQLKPQVDS